MEEKMNGSDKNVVCMERIIEIAERMIENCKEHFELYDEAFVAKEEINAIEHLIKVYKEQNDIIKTANIAINDLQEKLKNYIPVSLVKEKIEEIDKEIEYQKLYGNVSKREELETKKEHFLELLEGE